MPGERDLPNDDLAVPRVRLSRHYHVLEQHSLQILPTYRKCVGGGVDQNFWQHLSYDTQHIQEAHVESRYSQTFLHRLIKNGRGCKTDCRSLGNAGQTGSHESTDNSVRFGLLSLRCNEIHRVWSTIVPRCSGTDSQRTIRSMLHASMPPVPLVGQVTLAWHDSTKNDGRGYLPEYLISKCIICVLLYVRNSVSVPDG